MCISCLNLCIFSRRSVETARNCAKVLPQMFCFHMTTRPRDNDSLNASRFRQEEFLRILAIFLFLPCPFIMFWNVVLSHCLCSPAPRKVHQRSSHTLAPLQIQANTRQHLFVRQLQFEQIRIATSMLKLLLLLQLPCTQLTSTAGAI